jgi:hypothetical protein
MFSLTDQQARLGVDWIMSTCSQFLDVLPSPFLQGLVSY